MIKKLLVVFAAAAVISIVCFTVVGILGGLPPAFGPQGWGPAGPPWATGDWNNRRAGPVVTRNLPFTGSERLDLGYPADIVVTQGPETRFTVTGPQYVLDQLRLEGSSLIWDGWGRRRWGSRFYGRLRIDIVSPAMHEFHLSGAQKLTLRDFDQDSLIVNTSGAGDVEAHGKARRLDARVTGAGDLNLDDLTVDDARVSISGAGDVKLDARKSSDVSISGAGDVRLKCRPASVTFNRSGFGDVNYGPDCSTLPPPASSAPPSGSEVPASPAPRSKV
jgi:hypothetical protein